MCLSFFHLFFNIQKNKPDLNPPWPEASISFGNPEFVGFEMPLSLFEKLGLELLLVE
jgi:hypothetical protein